MKGLEEYTKKYGNHFTQQLADAVTKKKWDAVKVMKDAQKRVYYNVTGSTSGDMVYLMDMFHHHSSHNDSIKTMLLWVGDYNKSGGPFCIWLASMLVMERDFDFTPYI